jgi:hypothetical protein
MATILTYLYPQAYTFSDARSAGVIDEAAVRAAPGAAPVPLGAVISANETVVVRGWAIDPSRKQLAAGVILTLGDACSEAAYGVPRHDVATHFCNEALTASGFRGAICPAREQRGSHELQVFAVGIDGTSAYRVGSPIALTIVDGSAKIVVSTPLRPGFAVYHVDRGPGERVPRGDTLTVSGWAYDRVAGAPVRGVFLTIDDTNLVHGLVGFARPDVVPVLHGKSTEASGFLVNFDTTGLTVGNHQARIGFISADGITQESFALARGVEILPHADD